MTLSPSCGPPEEELKLEEQTGLPNELAGPKTYRLESLSPSRGSPDEELKLEELAERTGLPDEDLARTLQSLACAKYKILRKTPASRNVAKGDVFTINRKFSDRMRRIKVRCPHGGFVEAVDEPLGFMSG